MSGIDVQTTCYFNDGVECAGKDRLRCRTCGWFPPEAERRRKEFEEIAHANATRARTKTKAISILPASANTRENGLI